jgi:hypothetical protein
LREGLLEAASWQRGEGDRQLYAGVFKRGMPFTPEQIFALVGDRYRSLDGVSRDAFRVLSGALVMALLDQHRGRVSLAHFCRDVPTFQGEVPILLRRHFPELNVSGKSLAKWWALTLARLSDAPVTEAMNIRETERQLEEALVLRFEKDGEWQAIPFARRSDAEELHPTARRAAIQSAQQALNRLSFRCFPSYRPLLVEYQEQLAEWARGGNDSEAVLAELAGTREVMWRRALRARDFLDYMEIVGATELSGGFDDYLELKRDLAERSRPERDDPVSTYLDRMNRIYAPSNAR